jgi:hypothetical protein
LIVEKSKLLLTKVAFFNLFLVLEIDIIKVTQEFGRLVQLGELTYMSAPDTLAFRHTTFPPTPFITEHGPTIRGAL